MEQQEAADVTKTEPGLKASEEIITLKRPPSSGAAEPHWKNLQDPREREHVVSRHIVIYL